MQILRNDTHPILVAVWLSSICFILGSAGYLILKQIVQYPFGAVFRMFCYHSQFPFQYIALVSICYGIVGSFWHACFKFSCGKRRFFSILVAILLALCLASPLGGIMWAIHDMQAGYFPKGRRFWLQILSGMSQGLSLGWLIMLLSIPYNVFGLILGMLVMHRLPRPKLVS